MIWLFLALLLLPTAAWAQNPGFFLIGPGTGRTACTDIPNPATNLTWCADGTPPTYTWKVWNGSTYVTITSGGGGAPVNATYILKTADPALTKAQALDVLATGFLINATGTGVLSVYGGFSCPAGEVLRQITATGLGICTTAGTGTISGSGALNQITVWSSASTVTGFSDFLWDDTNAVLDLGGNTTVGAASSFVIGQSNTVDGPSVSVQGHSNNMGGANGSGAWGDNNTVGGQVSWAVGSTNNIGGFNSQAFGELSSVSGNVSTAVGHGHDVQGDNSAAVGSNNTVTHDHAYLFGEGMTSQAATSVSLGVSAIPEVTITASAVATNAGTDFTLSKQATGGAAQCLQVDSVGLVTATGLPCSSGFSGTVIISGTSTTGSVAFGTAQADTTYTVTFGTRDNTGTPPAVLAHYLNKTVNGFDIEITAPPGVGNSVAVDYQVGAGAFGSVVSGSGSPGNIAIFNTSNTLTDFAGDACAAGEVATAIGADGALTCATPASLGLVNVKTCVVSIGDPGAASAVLVDDNDAPVACPNNWTSDWTITSVGCWADAGSPTVTPILTGGAADSILTGALTCGTASWAAGTVNGSPVVHSFSGGATCSSTPCSADVNITAADGVAKYIVIKISGTL